MSPKPPYIPLSSSSIRGCPLTERSERIPYPEVPQDQREQERERKRKRELETIGLGAACNSF